MSGATWKRVTLGEIGRVITGKTPSTREPSNYGHGVPFIKPPDVHGGRVIVSAGASLTPKGTESARVLPPGSVLVTCIGVLGRVGITGVPAATNQQINAIVPDLSRVRPKWLALACQAPEFQEQLQAVSSATTVRLVNASRFTRLEIAIPPLDVQDAIVEEIEMQLTRLDAGATTLGAAELRLERYRAAVLGTTIGGELSADSPIREGPLSQFAEVQLGRQRSPKNHFGPNMKPYLRAANVTWNGLDLSDVKEMNFSPSEVERFALRPGDLLLSEASGSQYEVGKPAIWVGAIQECCFQNTLLRVRCHDVLPEFLLLVFQHAASSGAFGRAARGVGIHHLGAKTLSEWPVRIPEPDAQEKIVEITRTALAALDSVEVQVRTGKRRAVLLKRMILRKAFKGELVPVGQEGVA